MRGVLKQKAGTPGKAVLLLATWFGIGFLPVAPGTFATLAALPLAVGMNKLGVLPGALFLAVFLSLAFWSADRAQRRIDREDPQEIVVDEAAGLLVALFLVPLSWFTVLLGFVLFRVFDVWKPFPLKRMERIPGGAGILLDDLLAGLYANLGLRVVQLISGW